jgi:thioredoxin 1
MVHIVDNDNEINNLIATCTTLVVVDVFTTWCGPCKILSPKLDMMEAEFTNVKFVKVDADKMSSYADDNGVNALPTIILFKNGKEVERVTGLNEKGLRDAITKHM